MTATKSNTLKFTQTQLLTKINRDDSCAINALFKLMDFDAKSRDHGGKGINIHHRGFFASLCDQVAQRRKDHDRGIRLQKPLLTPRQFVYLRDTLEKYLNELYFIAEERTGLSKDAPEPRGCYCHEIPYSIEPTICGYCDSH